MQAKTDLTINAVNQLGKKVSNKVSYVNNNITNSQAVQLATMINGLTKNTYSSTTKTQQTTCDATGTLAQVTGLRVGTDGTLTLTEGVFTGTVPVSLINNKKIFTLNFTTAGGLPDKMFTSTPPYLMTEQEDTKITNYNIQRAYTGSGQSPSISLMIGDSAGQTAHTLTGSLIFPASEFYDETEIKFSITFEAGV